MRLRLPERPGGLRRARARRHQRATVLIETLLAAPIVLLLGLGALQWVLLFHARAAIEYGVFEAARAGSVAQARIDAIEDGLARGLMPFWQGSDALRPLPVALAASRVQLRHGLAAGWIVVRQLSPTIESFADWAEPARDPGGRPIAGTMEIPNDSLQWAALRAPAGGTVAMRGREAIGRGSQQTLNDANLLKLELRYGVPMTVPLIGSVAAWILRIIDGCVPPTRRRIGLVDLGTPATTSAARAWACSIHHAPDEFGRPVARWPVRASATVRMQSAARRSSMTPHRAQSAVRTAGGGGTPATRESLPRGPDPATGSASAGSGGEPTWLATPAAPKPVDDGEAAGVGVAGASDPSEPRRASGWLRIGGERTFSVPGACT